MQETIVDLSFQQHLQARVRGEVICPRDERYDPARRVWNGRIDRYPALIVRCADLTDVLASSSSPGEKTWPWLCAAGVTVWLVIPSVMVASSSTSHPCKVYGSILSGALCRRRRGSPWVNSCAPFRPLD